MNKTTFTHITRAITFALLVPIAHSLWQWAAPWYMKDSYSSAVATLNIQCKTIKGCGAVKAFDLWRPEIKRYVPHMIVVASNAMSNADRVAFGQTVRETVFTSARHSYAYRAQIEAVSVGYQS